MLQSFIIIFSASLKPLKQEKRADVPSRNPFEEGTKLKDISHNNLTLSKNVFTPGRLRLGLSRNRKVSKPLHQNVVFKVS